MDERDFPHWYYEEASDEDRALHDRLYDFEDLFDDMRFEPGTPSYDLVRCQSRRLGSDEWVDDSVQLDPKLEYFSYGQVRTEVVETLDRGLGFYDPSERLLCLSREYASDDATLLHEMTHVHEEVVNGLPLHYHDTLLWALYKHLRGRVSRLDDAIDQHAHLLNETDISQVGGVHDTLFLLKTFDLDMRMGYRLGTVFGYEDKERFDYLTYEDGPAESGGDEG